MLNDLAIDASRSAKAGPITALRPELPTRYGPTPATKFRRFTNAAGLNQFFAVGSDNTGLMPVASGRHGLSVFWNDPFWQFMENGKPPSNVRMPPNCHPPMNMSAILLMVPRKCWPWPKGRMYRLEVVHFWPKLKAERPRSRARLSGCVGVYESPFA